MFNRSFTEVLLERNVGTQLLVRMESLSNVRLIIKSP